MLNRPFCGTCAAFDNGVCRFAPPAAFPLGMAPPNLAGGQPRMITGAAFPRVNPDADWCMQHIGVGLPQVGVTSEINLEVKAP